MKTRLSQALGIVLVLVLAMLLTVGASAQNETTHLAFLFDGSQSIPAEDFQIMKLGLAEALQDETCVPQDGSFELTVIQFSDIMRVAVPPTIITADNIAAVAAQIEAMDQIASGTNYEIAFDQAIATINNSLESQLINLTSDGAPTMAEKDTAVLRQRAVAAGFDEIDAEGLAITTEETIGVLRDAAYPQPATVHPPSPWPPADPGWVRLVEDANDFADTVCEKLGLVIQPTPVPPTATPVPPTATPVPPTATPSPTPIPEPATLLLLGGGLAAAGAYLRKRRESAD